MEKEYFYQDRDNELLQGEVWRDIRGFEKFYQVSNKGRVKSLDRTIFHPRLKFQFVKGRILKQKIVFNKNTIATDQLVNLQVALSKNGENNFFNVRRLVYAHFIKPINFEKDRLCVVNKNGDGFNNEVENLLLVNNREKWKRSFKAGRVPESHLAIADRTTWKDKVYGGVSRRKKIRRIAPNGRVEEFESIKEASRLTGFGEKEIIGVAKGRYKKWKGYRWEYVEC